MATKNLAIDQKDIMNMGLVVLLLVGVILMTANSVKVAKAKAVEAKADKEKVDSKNGKAVAKHKQFDIEEFYRQDALHKPSKLFYSMFSNEDIKR